MTKWHPPIQGKFTDEEADIILDYMRRHKIKSVSKLVRMAIEDMIGLSVADRERVPMTIPPEYSSVYNFYEGYRKCIKSPEELKVFDGYLKQWDAEFWEAHTTEINKKLSEANKMWTAFKEHKSTGRPRSAPRKRGRPPKHTDNN